MRGTGENMDGIVGFPPAKKAEGLGTPDDRNGGSSKMMSGVGRGKFCMGEGGLLLHPLSCQQEMIGFGTLFYYGRRT